MSEIDISKNSLLRIAVSSVLAYVIFVKVYNLLTESLLWFSVHIRLDNRITLVVLNVLLCLVGLLVLNGLYKKFIKAQIPPNSNLVALTGISVLITLIYMIFNKAFGAYMYEANLEEYQIEFLAQYGWKETVDSLMPVVALIYFLIQIRMTNTSSNDNQTN